MKRTLAAMLALLAFTGCTVGKPSTEGRQVSARNACQDLVRNRVGSVTFRDARETQATSAGKTSTTYTATGRADTDLGSYRYRCTATIAASDMTLRTRLVTLEL